MKKLAIISSYNESCGNASYTEVLRKAFSVHVAVEVIPLDLFVLQKGGSFYGRHGDRHIDEIAKKLSEFDYVNIQFEAGLYGRGARTALRRVTKLINASKNVIVTMHRIDPPQEGTLETIDFLLARKFHPLAFWKVRNTQGYINLYRDIVNVCAARAKEAKVSIAVHTRRECRIVKDLYGFSNVFCYPLTFLQEAERKAVLQATDPAPFRARHHVPEDVKIIGAFGFVSKYKGYETLLKTLTILPDNYHLYIFGGQHPQSLKANAPLDSYLKELFDLIAEEERKKRDDRKRDGTPQDALDKHAKTFASEIDVRNRVHFMGGLSDPDFIEALRFSNYTVLPYLEVGQSMSGVVALAIESGANLFCSNNHSFNEARKLWGDVYHTFDIGNHMELAEKIQHANRDFSKQRDEAYRKYNISNNILRHLEAFGHAVENVSLCNLGGDAKRYG